MHAITCILHRKIYSCCLNHSDNVPISIYSNSASNLESNDMYTSGVCEVYNFMVMTGSTSGGNLKLRVYNLEL